MAISSPDKTATTKGADEVIATNPGGALMVSNTAGPSTTTTATTWGPRSSRARWLALGAATLLLAWAYAPNFRDLIGLWWDDSNYSHGFLVVPIALYVLWQRLTAPAAEKGPDQAGVGASWWAWAVLAMVLAVRAVAYEQGLKGVETATLLPVLACLTWTFGGAALLRRAWPPILFLVFMLPLPNFINGLISLRLQWIAATSSRVLLQLSGLWVIQQGNVLQLKTPFGMESLDVALACNGLKMLMSLTATVTATIMLFPLPRWKQFTLLASAVPIAIVSNVLRITATGWCYVLVKDEHHRQVAHDWVGYLLMMPLALVLVLLETLLLAWLAPEGVDEDEKVIIPLLIPRERPGGKRAGGEGRA